MIRNCPEVLSIVVTDCHSLPRIEVFNATKLKNLNLNYDSSMSSLFISENSVSSIETINLRNVNISGFNFYNDENKKYDEIPLDPLGNKLLDFSKFDNLKSDGIIIKRELNGDYTSDKCSNFEAIRLPNRKDRAFSIVDTNIVIGYRFSRLRNLYGHISLGSFSFGENCGKPSNGLFLNGASTVNYKDY